MITSASPVPSIIQHNDLNLKATKMLAAKDKLKQAESRSMARNIELASHQIKTSHYDSEPGILGPGIIRNISIGLP